MASELRFVRKKKMWYMPISNTYCERETSITWPIIDRFPFISFYLEFGNSVTLFINTKNSLEIYRIYTIDLYNILRENQVKKGILRILLSQINYRKNFFTDKCFFQTLQKIIFWYEKMDCRTSNVIKEKYVAVSRSFYLFIAKHQIKIQRNHFQIVSI